MNSYLVWGVVMLAMATVIDSFLTLRQMTPTETDHIIATLQKSSLLHKASPHKKLHSLATTLFLIAVVFLWPVLLIYWFVLLSRGDSGTHRLYHRALKRLEKDQK